MPFLLKKESGRQVIPSQKRSFSRTWLYPSTRDQYDCPTTFRGSGETPRHVQSYGVLRAGKGLKEMACAVPTNVRDVTCSTILTAV